MPPPHRQLPVCGDQAMTPDYDGFCVQGVWKELYRGRRLWLCVCGYVCMCVWLCVAMCVCVCVAVWGRAQPRVGLGLCRGGCYCRCVCV